jgi:short-subunit dehydrogenase
MGHRRHIAGSRLLITGASQGIGKALADLAARRGARVIATARSLELLEELSATVRGRGDQLEIIQADVTNADDRQRMVEAAIASYGGLDILVNNAGIGATGMFADAAPERLRKIMEVNFFGLTETTRLFIPLLRMGNFPAIVNICSVAGKRGIPARSEYSASKFAVQGFSEALRAELDKDGIDVLVVSPGLTQTNFSKNMLEQKAKVKFDHLRGMTAEQVAAATLRTIEQGRHEVCLTFQGRLMVFLNRFFPRLTDRIAAKKVRAAHGDAMPPQEKIQKEERETVVV